jgi:uncharacterized protein YdeI (YjbR/CyaY-like superfamily)
MKTISPGVAHTIPKDLRIVLESNKGVCGTWNELTPLARNEWICWIISVKKEATRTAHITRLCEDLKKGKRRPCCWAGCSHRT